MKSILISIVSLVAAPTAKSTVLVEWPSLERDAAVSWLTSVSLNAGEISEKRVFSTLDDTPSGSASLIGRLTVGSDVGLLSVFGLDRPPSNLNLMSIDGFGASHSLLAIGYSDCTLDAGHFTYSGTFFTHPDEWRSLRQTESLFLAYTARDGSPDSVPMQLVAVPEPNCLILISSSLTVCFCRRTKSPHRGKPASPDSDRPVRPHFDRFHVATVRE